MLRKGQVVEVYQRPLTREDLEGKAELVNRISRDRAGGLERWRVRFLDEPDGGLYLRNIVVEVAP